MPLLERMTVKIDWKVDATLVPDEWKADAEESNILIGYASTFGNVDRGGDVVMPGAFLKTIANIKANGIPLLADHMASTASVLGTIFDAKEDRKGLLIKARVSQAPSAQDVAIKAREGHLNKMSIGYETMAESFEDRSVDGMDVRVRKLDEVKLWETSVVVFPMNEEAAITAMKALNTFVSETKRVALKAALDDLENTAPVGTVAASGESQEGSPEAEAKSDGNDPSAGDKPAPASDEGASGYDKYASRAILAGRPVEDVDPVTRATLTTRLQLAESQLPTTITETE